MVMDLFERLLYVAIGGVLGFILGVIVTYLHEIKEELDEVDHILKDQGHIENDETGAVSWGFFKKYYMLIIVILVAYAAFASQNASNHSNDNAAQLKALVVKQDRISSCNKEFLGKLLNAVNERTASNQAQIQANVALQAAQAKFFGLIIRKPPPNPDEGAAAAQKYFGALNDFLETSKTSAKTVAKNPYPQKKSFTACINKKENP